MEETANLRTNVSSQPDKAICSECGQKFDVFLSHSGKQKIFARQLHRELTNQGVSCFFDEDPESLPVGEDFPSRIFEAAITCKVAILLISKDFIETKWPMLELSTIVEARDITRENPSPKIVPVFFMIPPEALKKITADNEKWKEFEKCEITRSKWHRALNVIRKINGLKFTEDDDEVEFRDKIMKLIWCKLPTPSERYHGPYMLGEVRMCQEVADFFKTVQANEKEIHIAGLYGIAGQGKTTLGKAFCNHQLRYFQGRVCHLEFSRGDSLQRVKLALDYLTHYPQSQLQELTSQDQAQGELSERVKGQRALLVLDNIADENIDEVKYYLGTDLGKNSWILISARSEDLLVKKFNIDSKLCMLVPRLNNDEAIGILLESTSLAESELGTEDVSIALMCANRCFFKGISCDTGAFHPLALKAFGGHLNSKFGPTLSKWGAEVDGFDDVFAVLDKAFHDLDPKYRTIFMLLTVYMLPDMSTHKITEWLAIICNEEMEYVEKAVKDLLKMAFIENFKPEIRIHELYIEFAQCKAKRMGRWLWWKGNESSTRALIPQDQAGFELAKLEQSIYRSPSQIAAKYRKNLLVLQLVGVQNIRTLDLSRMDSLRSITLHYCKDLVTLDGMENLPYLAWLQIRGVNPVLKLPDLSSLRALQHLEIHIPVSHELGQMADLTPCVFLREIKVFYPSLVEFPSVNGLPYLEKLEFRMCCRVMKPLDCENCETLHTVVLDGCCRMAASPHLAGCKKLSKIVLSECNAFTTCPVVDVESCDGLENLQLWDMGEVKEISSCRRLINLTVLKIGKCGIREPPDLTSCAMLEDVYLFTLKSLEKFPNFSSLAKLKKLSLCNCTSVQDPPDIEGCHQLQVFHLLYNDNMKGLSKMDMCEQLEEIKVSWHCEDQVVYQGFDPESCQGDDNLDSCLDYWKDLILENINDIFVPVELKEWQRMQGKTMLVKKFFRGVKLYYFVTAPYESYKSFKRYSQNSITLRLVGNRVLAFPTLEGASKHCEWLKKVRGYFAAKKFIARASTRCENMEANSPLPLPRYRVPAMQGESRMCQEVADFINQIVPNEKGFRFAGLYGMLGQGKTTLGKAYCNFKLGDFGGRVCHLDFSRGNRLDRQKLVLKYLGDCRESQLEWVKNEDEAHYFFETVVENQKVLLVLDDIAQASIDERKYYRGLQLGEDSCILSTALVMNTMYFNIEKQSWMRVPILTEEEAIAILMEGTSVNESALRAEHRSIALKWADRCSYKSDRDSALIFHPLALKTFGRHFFSKHRYTRVAAFEKRETNSLNDVVDGLGKAFDDMDPKQRTIFCRLILSRTTNTSSEVVQCLAQEMNLEIKYINEVVDDLCKNGFIEEIEPRIRIHPLVDQFVNRKNITGLQMGPKNSVGSRQYPNQRKDRLHVIFS